MRGSQIRERLLNGEIVKYRGHGNSMTGKIESGQLITLIPPPFEIEVGDVVFCKVKGHYYDHLVTAIRGKQYQISNNHGHVNGWVTRNSIFGKCIAVED